MSAQPGVGRRVDAKYVLIEPLGSGGMATVWLARDERLGKLWAIKEIKQNVGGIQEAALRQAMIDEANFMKRLDHPAIPRVVDILDTGASVFVVMDYVDGVELSKVMRRQGHPFDQKSVIDWGIQLCDVLGYLHNAHPPIVYRDMKPANIMLRDDGVVKLVDFGVSMECVPGQNNDGRIVGTPGYAAPEQMPPDVGRMAVAALDPNTVIDGRADIYALGVTLYALVTGHVPRRSSSDRDVDDHEFCMRPIREWNPQLSEGLERVILKATATNPEDRYATIDAMRYDLEHYEQLTEDWRKAQRAKTKKFQALVLSAAMSVLVGASCLLGARLLVRSSFEVCLLRAADASCKEDDSGISEAESLYAQAISLAPKELEAYRGLLDVYENDFTFTEEEERRLRKTFARASDLSGDPRFAQLCFDVGTCYLSYFGIDRAGGSVGNAALSSIDAAAPWFRRVVELCEDPQKGAMQTIDAGDVRAAQSYSIIAEFHQKIARAGREGRSSTEEYVTFWDSLSGCIAAENAREASERSPEGVRIRLCQVAVESTASATYLLGLSRAGVTQDQVRALLDEVQQCVEGLADFVRLEECRVVYGPVLEEINEGLTIAKRTLKSVYENPVARMNGAGEGEQL